MVRQNGFQRADMNTSLFEEPKVVSLARYLKDERETLVHTSLYVATILRSWRDGQRATLEESWPGWCVSIDPTVQDNLQFVGLLDSTGRIRQEVFDAWYGPAAKRRDGAIAAGSRGGHTTAALKRPADDDIIDIATRSK